jgi:hypothetical protein
VVIQGKWGGNMMDDNIIMMIIEKKKGEGGGIAPMYRRTGVFHGVEVKLNRSNCAKAIQHFEF